MLTLPFFEVFSFNILKGESQRALSEPLSAVLSENRAKLYFGEEDPIGKMLNIDNIPVQVTAVVEDIPFNSHLQFDILLSMSTAQLEDSGYAWLFDNWYTNTGYTYLLLEDRFDPDQLRAKLPAFDQRHARSGESVTHHYELEPLKEIYLHSKRQEQIGATGSATRLYIFAGIALFILMLACINFVNLSTARAAERSKEVGIKKSAGASRVQLSVQFLTESFVTVFLAMVLALFCVEMVLPAFNTFTAKYLSLNLLEPSTALVLISLFFTVVLLAGAYPAFVLSGFNPAKSLKGPQIPTGLFFGIRKLLVVFQFVVSVVLIVGSMVVYLQLQFFQNYELGFNRSQTMIINFSGNNDISSKYRILKEELKRISGVQQVTLSSNIPGDRATGTWSMKFVKQNGDTIRSELPIYLTDEDFLSQYGIKMIAGRTFNPIAKQESAEMLINESAVNKLGLSNPKEAIGMEVGMYPNKAMVVGVVKDFHYESLQKSIAPLTFRQNPPFFKYFSIALNTLGLNNTISEIQKLWDQNSPKQAMDYSFLDESFNQQYISEIRFGQVVNMFCLLAILIACLGLFGLVLFSVQQRTREIGIRKVLGASVRNITALLSEEFLWLVLVASLVAIPIAWWGMDHWLRDFAYRIEMEAWVFIFAILIVLMLALLTISVQSIRAALANPADSLRSE